MMMKTMMTARITALKIVTTKTYVTATVMFAFLSFNSELLLLELSESWHGFYKAKASSVLSLSWEEEDEKESLSRLHHYGVQNVVELI